MSNKYRNPSFWRNISVIDDDNNEIYNYEVDLSGKLKLPLKSKWTPKSKKYNAMIKLQQTCKTNQENIKCDSQPIISSNIDIISSQIISTNISPNGDSNLSADNKQNVNNDFEFDMLQFGDIDENINDEYWYYYFNEDDN